VILLDYLDLIAPVFTLGGIWLLTERRRSGFLVASMGSVLWLIIGLLGAFSGRAIWGLVGLSLATLCLNWRGYYMWGQPLD
jgi:hypothetical protein